jgi:hypothetical protein
MGMTAHDRLGPFRQFYPGAQYPLPALHDPTQSQYPHLSMCAVNTSTARYNAPAEFRRPPELIDLQVGQEGPADTAVPRELPAVR